MQNTHSSDTQSNPNPKRTSRVEESPVTSATNNKSTVENLDPCAGKMASRELSTPRPQLIPDDMTQIATSRVGHIIQHLLLHANIAASQVKLPSVEVSTKEGTSFYDRERNAIVFHPSHLNSLSTYGEEIFHWLRNQLKPAAEKLDTFLDLPVREQHAVEEFYGFVGRAVAHNLTTRINLDGFDESCRIGFSSDTVNALKGSRDNVEVALNVWSPENRSVIQSASTTIRGIESDLTARSFNSALLRLALLRVTIPNATEKPLQAISEQTPPTHPVEMLLFCARNFCQQFPEELVKQLASQPEIAHEPHSAQNKQEPLFQKLNEWISVTNKLALIFERRLSDWDSRRQQLIDHKTNSTLHIPGYEAGKRFLEREPHPEQAIFKLLSKPSIDIYMTQIHQPAEQTDVKSLLSAAFALIGKNFGQWAEKRRLQAEAKQEKVKRQLATWLRERL